MTAFTVIGVLWFWMFCFQMGQLIGLACDAKRCLDEFTKPVDDSIAELVHLVAFWDAKSAKGAA